MGYAIAGAWLDAIGRPDADTWVNFPAAAVLTVAREAGGAPLR